MSRKEKKEKADKKRLEIAKSLLAYMKEVAKTISDEKLKTDPHNRWKYILERGDRWVNDHMKLYPQEAHMYKSAAIMANNWIVEVLKDKGNKNE